MGLSRSLSCQDSIHNRFISLFIQSFVGSSTLGNILKGTLEVPHESAGRCASRRVSAAAPGSDSPLLDHKSWKGVNTASRDSSHADGRSAPTMMQIQSHIVSERCFLASLWRRRCISNTGRKSHITARYSRCFPVTTFACDPDHLKCQISGDIWGIWVT